MKRLVSILAALALSLSGGCGLKSTAPKAEVKDAWVRLPAVPGRPGGGYFRIEINGTRETLLAVTSPSAERIEIHQTVSEGGRTRMERLEQFSTQRGAPLVAEPGGTHLMLFGIDPALRPGGTIELDFRFLLAPPATAQARLVAAGEPGPQHGGR